MRNFEWEDPRSDVICGAMKWVARLRDAERNPERKAKLVVILQALVPPDVARIKGQDHRLTLRRVEEAQKLLPEKGLLPRSLRSLLKWCLRVVERDAREQLKWEEVERRAKTS